MAKAQNKLNATNLTRSRHLFQPYRRQALIRPEPVRNRDADPLRHARSRGVTIAAAAQAAEHPRASAKDTIHEDERCLQPEAGPGSSRREVIDVNRMVADAKRRVLVTVRGQRGRSGKHRGVPGTGPHST